MKKRLKEVVKSYYDLEIEARKTYPNTSPMVVRQNIDEMLMVIAYLYPRKFKNFTEIGCAEGASLWIYSKMLGISDITAIEINQHEPFIFICNRLKAKMINSDSIKVADTIQDNSIDLLHIDGNHELEAVKRDWELYYPKVIKGGIILLHDTVGHKGPKLLIKELRDKYDIKTFYAEKAPCGISLIKK